MYSLLVLSTQQVARRQVLLGLGIVPRIAKRSLCKLRNILNIKSKANNQR